jgi:dipeptidyl-peptidase-3
MRARFALLQVMLRAGENFIKIEKCQQNGKDYLNFNMDREKILTVGKKAVSEFMNKL